MRIAQESRLFDELDSLKPYLAFNGEKWDVKPDAPDEIKKKYNSLQEEYRKIRFGDR